MPVLIQSHACGCTLPPSLPIAQAHIACSLGGGGTDPLIATISTMHPERGDAGTASAREGGKPKGSINDASKDDNKEDELESNGSNVASGEEGTPLKCNG